MSNSFITAMLATVSIVGPVLGQGLLDDFSSLRKNNMGTALFAAYLGEDPNQTSTVENGMLKLTIGAGSAPYMHFFPNTGAGYSFPAGFAQNFLESGTWNVNMNRLRFWVKCGRNITRRGDGGDILQIGTYVKSHSADPQSQGSHFYHLVDPNFYANRWMLIEINRQPQHQVGANGGTAWPEDPTWSSANTHYFDGLTRFYFDATGGTWDNQTCYFDNFEFDLKSGEPEAQVSSMTATYNGQAYEVAWAAPKNVSTSYEIRYSTNSMKTAGFNSGTSGGVVTSPGNAYTGTFWKSPAIAEANVLFVGIRPTSGNAFTELRIPRVPGSDGTVSGTCDVNSDGAVNRSDVDLAVDEALGKQACTDDLNKDGKCDVIDVQRIVNASIGGSCRVGQ